MEWRESLEPTAPRLVITFLLLVYCVFAFTFFPMHVTACTQEGVDCSSYVYHVSLYHCLSTNFYEAHQGPSMYFVSECSKISLLWVIPLALVLYVISPAVHRSFTRGVDAWRYGSKNEIVTFVLCVLTLVPGLLAGAEPELYVPSIVAYGFFPFALFYTCVDFMRLGRFLVPVVIFLVLVFIAFTAHTWFRKWEITHARMYLIWVMYLAVTVLGGILVIH